MSRVYLDHNATSPLRLEAREAMLAALALAGNASSVHAEGRAARAMVEDARERIAACIGCAPRQIIFTSGGTEANVMALSPDWLEGNGPKRAFVSAVEHPSVLRGGRFAPDQIETLPVDSERRRRPRSREAAFCRLARGERWLAFSCLDHAGE